MAEMAKRVETALLATISSTRISNLLLTDKQRGGDDEKKLRAIRPSYNTIGLA